MKRRGNGNGFAVGAGGGEREGVFVAVVVPRCLSLSRDVILKSGSPFHQQQVIQLSGRMFHS